MFKKNSKHKEIQSIIEDLSSIITACQQAIEACSNASEYEGLKRDLVTTYEERERQYKRLGELRS